MPRPPRRPIAAAGIIERADGAIFVVLRSAPEGQPRLWQFPRGPANPGEPAEAAMRRIAREQLGIEVEAAIGQPPLVQTVDGKEFQVRYFFCGFIEGQPRPGPYAEVRWVSKPHLREYDFDPPSAEVVQWLLSE